ncbi:MAG TPA: UvrB/UvrC motif-containing protein, partial [Chthoniobacteraceae bacterium]
ETFSEGLQSLIKGMHKGTVHLGKTPTRMARTLERDAQLKTLQRDLRKAVSEENYESAAQLRDQIKHLEVEG